MFNFCAYPNMTKCIIPDGVDASTNFSYAFYNMKNLCEISIPNYVTNIDDICYNCTNLKKAVCPTNAVSMYKAYQNCKSYNLTTPVCGNNVTQMSNAYNGCTYLTTAVCGDSMIEMRSAYAYCNDICGNAYFYSSNIKDARSCFYGHNKYRTLNIYVPENSKSLSTLLVNNTFSIIGAKCTWTNDIATNGRYYNTTSNIYIYPVANVEAVRIANGDPDNMGNL